ncbi:MAG TPA: alpha/beta fold hydrolase [Thermoanaerobaculia bacterium]|nr:alpha/beta fold hydrolase [Thermoanaerobaculia bacterium]
MAHSQTVPASLTLMRGALGLLSRTSPEIASRVAADLFMKPRRFRTPEREQAILAEAPPFEVRLGASTHIQAWRWGAGPAVLLVHGWEGRGSQLAPFVRPLVESGHSVIAFDAPGHGASSGSRSSLPHFAYAVRGVAAATATPHAIVAHSLGCAATTLALRDGLNAQRLVFIAPPLNPSDYVTRFGEILGVTAPVLDRMKLRIEERFLRTWSDYSLEQTAREMTAPLLIVHDRGDVETFHAEGAALAAAWPNARFISTEGLGHRRILRDEKVLEMTTTFIAG